MRAKMARSDPRPLFGLPEVTVAVRTSLLSCTKARNTRVFMPAWVSSGKPGCDVCQTPISSSRGAKPPGSCFVLSSQPTIAVPVRMINALPSDQVASAATRHKEASI
jgi:hypothetical protein